MLQTLPVAIVLLCGIVMTTFASGDEPADCPVPVQLKCEQNRWQLVRAGKPYKIRGAAGPHSLAVLAQCGGNSTRVWDVGADTRQRLDEALQNGVSVVLGVWLEHERRGFDYSDQAQIADQTKRVLAAVRQYRNHPAVLMWGIGNEMEGYDSGDNPAIWSHVEQLCQLIKKEDPNHPTMSVIAEIGGRRIEAINRFCPSLDVIGINAYGGAATLPARYREAGGNRPYIVTEFGPAGPWEVKKNEFGAVIEATSNDKARQYRQTYESLVNDQHFCLGSYAFIWGHKQEATATWFGMFLKDGRKTNVVDVMQTLWTGKEPDNLCPRIASLELTTPHEVVDSGEILEFRLDAADPEGEKLQVQWQLLREADAYVTGGDFQAAATAIEDSIVLADETMARIKAPVSPGVHRVYAIVDDGSGAVATANVPFQIRMKELEEPGTATVLPYVVYDDADAPSGYSPTGRIGQGESIELDMAYTTAPRSGQTCVYCKFVGDGKNAGVAWQHPAGDQGDLPGGFDLTGAQQLTFWAKGKAGGEKLSIGIGNLGPEHKYFDTVIRRKTFTLTRFWKKYQIDFANADMRRVKTGFCWTTVEPDEPIEFFIDDVVIGGKD